MLNTVKQVARGAVIGALLAVSLGWTLLHLADDGRQENRRRPKFPPATKLLRLSYDLPFLKRPIVRPTEVALIYMDDVSHRELGQPYDGPWDRGWHAQLVERMTADHARAVVFDILFTDHNTDHPEGDERFAKAIKENGKVVLGAQYTYTSDGSPTLIRAIDPFYDTAASASGFVEVLADDDFMVRRHLHAPPEKEADSYSSYKWEAAALIGAPITANPENRFPERWVNYYGPPRTITTVSFLSAVTTNTSASEFLPTGFFSNKVVFVGSGLTTEFSGVRKDEYKTPYTRGTFAPAMESQATQFLNLIRQDWLTHLSASAEMLLVVLAGIVFGAGLTFFRPVIASTLAVTAALLITVFAHFLFWRYRIWFDWVLIVAVQIPIALLWSIIFNSVQLYVQNKLFEKSLEMYLSPKLVKKFAANKDLLKPGAKKETLTILFSDIASFTSIAEGMDSDELARHMNGYFETAVSQCIHHTDGTIVKYIGDAIFAFWNAPDPQIDHAARACEAALRFRDQPPQFMNGQQLVTRIGLHTGVANVGNFGSTARVDYTALGENINLASRMEGLNKHLGTEVLITEETFGAINGKFLTRHLGAFQLKGFERSVGVYELVGKAGSANAQQTVHDAFTEAVNLFRAKQFLQAEAAFQKILEINPKDGPSKFYLKHLAELKDRALPPDWSGEVELTEK
jgi:adenylate cyclase